MKKSISMFAFVAMMTLGLSAFAKDEAAKPQTLTGTATCAKCALKETDKCQAALVVKEGDKSTTYYVKGKEGAALHKEVCKSEKENVSITGAVVEEGGHKWIVPTAAKK